MHEIYHTEAIILKSTTHGEANKRVWLFTKEFGVIVATVQGVRKSGAKLTGHIADYAYSMVDVIRGKEVWRLISATAIAQPITGRERLPMARAYVRTLSAIERFVVGEGADEFIFSHLKECIAILIEDVFDAKLFDTLSLWKLFVHLGYIDPLDEDEIITQLSLRDSYQYMNEERHKRFLVSVKTAIEQSHL